MYRFRNTICFVVVCSILFFATLFLQNGRVFASATLGIIDPNNIGNYVAQLVHDPALAANDTQINFGKFTTQSAYNITVSDTGLRGFFWGKAFGWAVTNCLDTVSGCSNTNGNFKVSVASDGTLSGYAWGQGAGWINFGPFSNSATEQVKISALGVFGGTSSPAGYAWSQSFGWIKFDCTTVDSCVTTDYIPLAYRTTPAQCSDGIDNDGDGLIDFPSDPGCTSGGDNDETNGGGGGGTPAQCSDGIDNDGDGLIDFPLDPGCTDVDDDSESNVISVSYQCSDGIDNDGDGKIDLLDPGCASATDNDETNAVVVSSACSDGIDNDGDGLIDYPSDPGCVSAQDSSEYNTPPPVYQCSDGIDNDGDGLIDFPSDKGCDSFSDDDETNTVIIPNDGSGSNGGGGNGGGGIQPTDGSIPSFASLAESTPIQTVGKTVSAVGLGSALLVGIFSALLNSPFLFADIWGLILSFFGFRKKHWGVVYDSQTKQPIDPAYVVLKDMAGNEIATSITDIEGRYGFLVSPGTYTIVANKTHYAFPSVRLAGQDHDAVYQDLYFGAPIVVTNKDQTILKNIPLDPIAVDWNEVAKRKQGLLDFYSMHENLFRTISNILFFFGLLFAIFTYVLSPLFWNLVVVCVYLVVFILEHLNILKPKTAHVIDVRGAGYPYALVEIYNANLDQKIATKVTSAYGRFLGLVPKGKYYAKVLKRDSLESETYTPVHQTDAFDAHTGYVEEKIVVKEKTDNIVPKKEETVLPMQ